MAEISHFTFGEFGFANRDDSGQNIEWERRGSRANRSPDRARQPGVVALDVTVQLEQTPAPSKNGGISENDVH